jgi:hypothetical protein
VAGAIGSVLELPFRRRPLYELLGFEDGRDEVNTEYTGYGWAQPARIWLQSGEDGELESDVMRIDAPLLLALHGADVASVAGSAGGVVLEFALDGRDEMKYAPLALFLERWLPQLPGRGAVVLAMCNPRRATVVAPAVLGGRPLYYALGNTDSWIDEPQDPAAPGELLGEDERRAGGRMRLVAEAWHLAEPSR